MSNGPSLARLRRNARNKSRRSISKTSRQRLPPSRCWSAQMKRMIVMRGAVMREVMEKKSAQLRPPPPSYITSESR